MSVFVLSAIVNIADQAFCIPFYGKEPMSKNPTQKSAPTKEKLSFPMTETHLQAPARVFQEEVQKIEAVIYAMAEKFLEKMDLEEVMEEISMTRLGEMLVNKGYDIGHSKGVEEEKLAAARNLLGQVSPDILAKALELPLDTILKLEKERESSSK